MENIQSNAVPKRVKKMLTRENHSLFFIQLSYLLQSYSLADSLAAMSESDDGDFKAGGALGKATAEIAAYAEAGGKLADALAESGVFREYAERMIRIGEEAGRLEGVTAALGDYYEREHALNVRIRNSLTYPAFLFVIMTAVIILLVGKVFPIFNDMLNNLGSGLSGAQNAVAAFSNSLLAGKYTMYALLIIAVLAIVIFALSRTKQGRRVSGRVGAAFPVTRKISARVAASRYANALSMTLASGIDFDRALDFATELVGSSVYAEKFRACAADVKNGGRLVDAIKKTGVFSSMQVRLIEIGVKTGKIDETMSRVARMCDDDAQDAIQTATSLVEPILVGVLSAVIGGILIMVIAPMAQIMTSIA